LVVLSVLFVVIVVVVVVAFVLSAFVIEVGVPISAWNVCY
jgi:hypothetical protein